MLPSATRTEIWAHPGADDGVFQPKIVINADDLVNAALAGFDRGEMVTIPGLHDACQWRKVTEARRAMIANLNRSDVSTRYRPG